MSRIKVCLVTIEYPPDPGGVGQSVCRIARMLRDSGYEVHVAVFHTRQALSSDGIVERGYDRECQEGIHVYRMRASIKSDVNEVVEFLSDVALELRGLHQQVGFGLFHAFFANETAFVATLVARELGVPVVVSVRGADLHKNVFNSRHLAHIIWTLENATWTTCVSRELESRAHVLAPGSIGRTQAFWNSVERFSLVPVSPRPPLAQRCQGLVVGTSGRFRNKKGVEYLIQACVSLRKELPLTLLLVGDFVEKEKSYWMQFIEECGMGDMTVLTGFVSREEALAYLPVMDIFVMPSLRDGCPNSLLEAMMAGRAVVGTAVDAIGEILIDGENGLVVEPASADALAGAIRKLAADRPLRCRLGRAARQFALKELSPHVEREHWLEVYRRALEESCPRRDAFVVTETRY